MGEFILKIRLGTLLGEFICLDEFIAWVSSYLCGVWDCLCVHLLWGLGLHGLGY